MFGGIMLGSPTPRSQPWLATFRSRRHPYPQYSGGDLVPPSADVSGAGSWKQCPTTPYIQDFKPHNGKTFNSTSRGRGNTSPSAISKDNEDGFDVHKIPSIEAASLEQLPFFRSQILKSEDCDEKTGQLETKANTTPGVIWKSRNESKPMSLTPKMGSNSISPSSEWSDYQPPQNDRKRRRFDLQLDQSVNVQHESFGSSYRPHAIGCESAVTETGKMNVPRIWALIRPRDPLLTQHTLQLLKPVVTYTQYGCTESCRSCGICVHFSFLLGCKQTPDGLICTICAQHRVEHVDVAQRLCPRHNKRTLSQFTTNRPEDILASDEQMARAHEILWRALSCHWEGVPKKVNTQPMYTRSIVSSPEKVPMTRVAESGLITESVVSSIEASSVEEGRPCKFTRLNLEDAVVEHEKRSDKENVPDTDCEAASDGATSGDGGRFCKTVDQTESLAKKFDFHQNGSSSLDEWLLD